MKSKLLSFSALFLTEIIIIFIFFRPISQDEGVFTAISQGILEGRSPYTDYFDHKPPGIYFLFLLPQILFSNSFLAVSVFHFMIVSLTLYLIYKISENLKKYSGLPAVFFCLLGYIFFEGYLAVAEPFLVTFVLFSFLFFYSYTKSKARFEIFLCGLFLGLALLVKQVAFLDFVVITSFLVWLKCKKGDLSVYLGGFMLPLLASLVYILAKSNIGDAISQILVLNFTSYPRENILVVLSWFFGGMIFSLPLWALSFYLLLKDRGVIFKDKLLFCVAILAIVPIPSFLIRHYPHYWIQVIPFVSILAGAAFVGLASGWLKKLILLSSIIMVIIFSVQKIPDNFKQWRAQGYAAKIIKSLPEKTILAENQFVGYYFLAHRQSLNKYLYLTEITDSQEAQQKTLNDLKNRKDIIILWPEDQKYAYAKEIQQYIKSNYFVFKKIPVIGLDIYRPNVQ